jgi:hypothetical protein
MCHGSVIGCVAGLVRDNKVNAEDPVMLHQRRQGEHGRRVLDDECVDRVLVPIGDGMTLTRRRG